MSDTATWNNLRTQFRRIVEERKNIMKKAKDFDAKFAAQHAALREQALNKMRTDISKAVDELYDHLNVSCISHLLPGKFYTTNVIKLPDYFSCCQYFPQEIKEEVEESGFTLYTRGNDSTNYLIIYPVGSVS